MEINSNIPNIKQHNLSINPSYNAVQINMKKPTVNAPAPSMIYGYPQADGQIYYHPANHTTTTKENGNFVRIPSGVEDYKNYSEYDKSGKEVASVKYSKEGNYIVQTIKTKSPDGTSLEKTLKNSPNFKHSNIIIKDKDGNILLDKEKSYQKFDNDKAQTIVNGETYNISGLSGNVLKVEHNGNETIIDLNKMLNPDVKLLKLMTPPEKLKIRDTKITNEEKEKLFNRIKSLGGDDLIRLSKSVEHIQFLDDKSIESFFIDSQKTLLLSPKDWENTHLVTEHELGHAIVNSGLESEQKEILSDREPFKSVREYERENFKNNSNMTNGDKLFESKFMFGDPDFDWNDEEHGDLESTLRNETFAESYNNLNSMDIIHYYDEVLPMRTLSLFKYMPKTMIEVEKLSQI